MICRLIAAILLILCTLCQLPAATNLCFYPMSGAPVRAALPTNIYEVIPIPGMTNAYLYNDTSEEFYLSSAVGEKKMVVAALEGKIQDYVVEQPLRTLPDLPDSVLEKAVNTPPITWPPVNGVVYTNRTWFWFFPDYETSAPAAHTIVASNAPPVAPAARH